MLRALVLGVFLMGVTGWTPALARTDIGTCLATAGVRVAPWTDGRDPACGEDCGPDDGREGREVEDLVAEACLEGECGLTSIWTLPPPSSDSAPGGPRCLTPGPSCEPGAPTSHAHGWAAATASPAEAPPLPRRASGTLPGAGPIVHHARPFERATPPPTPPPRPTLRDA